ncbi:MAG: single-stranded-DNA-specific exonuclease RecJ [Clostridia bacterium]|nr:single-stranded-DNA-specific exonuclease RecJ [Clostridia bacterium]
MQKKKWILLSKNNSRDDVLRISSENQLPPILATVLLNRGIEDVKEYLLPETEKLLDPFIMKGMEQATERILAAIKNGEHITVYGDYDVDGITSTAALVKFLSAHKADVDYYIPDRLEEGYGMNRDAIDRIAARGTKLMITVDCGITAVAEIEYAASCGMDVIVTDHHECKESLPDALCILNPKQTDCPYPFKKLAGVGVVFKLLQALTLKLKYHMKELLDEYLDLVAIGTVADVMPLLGENRIIVKKGLELMKYTTNKGIWALIEQAGIDAAAVTAGTIGFVLAPRINAAGRMGDPKCAVEMLLAQDEKSAREYAQMLDEENRERQANEQQIMEQALEILKSDKSMQDDYVLILDHEDWHHGIIGIVASKISERTGKPCVLISTTDENGKGSGRSIKGFNLFKALEHCAESLSKFGGHELAAGLSVKTDKIKEFRKKINEYAKEHLTQDDFIPKIYVDSELPIEYINMNTAEKLAVLEPYGMGNASPIFFARGLEIANIRVLSEGKHIKLSLNRAGCAIDAVGFSMGAYADEIKVHDKIDILFQLDINVFRGERQVQAILKDMRFSD